MLNIYRSAAVTGETHGPTQASADRVRHHSTAVNLKKHGAEKLPLGSVFLCHDALKTCDQAQAARLQRLLMTSYD